VSRGRTLLLLCLILAAAALLRFTGIGWGLPSWFHPDERAIVMNASSLSAADMNPHWFPYGSLPLYLLKGMMTALPLLGARGLEPVLIGRALSAAFGTATVLLLFLLARRLFGTTTGLLAAAFLAVAATHVQNSHYYTVDVPLTFFVLLSLFGAIGLAESGGWRHAVLAGAGFGLAAATKVSALPLVLPILVAAWLGRGEGRWPRAARCAALALATAVVVAFAAMPYAFLDHQAFLKDFAEQARMASGRAILPYTIQFKGTIPYLYPMEQLVRWSLGWPLGLLAVAAAVAAPLLAGLRRRGLAVLYAFILPFVAINAGLFAKYPRYLLPAVPLLLALAAAMLVTLRGSRRPVARLAGSLLPWVVLIPSALYCVAFLHVFLAPNPRIAASDYLHTYHAKGSRILAEHWDDRVPVTTERGQHEDFVFTDLPLYEPDMEMKWRTIPESLAQGDLVVLASQRLAASIPRDPARYPMASNYHRALLAGDLGFRVEAVFTTYPRLLGVNLRDDLADESIRVYDHPTVIILSRSETFTPTEIRRRIENPSEAALRWDLKALMSVAPMNPTAIVWEEGAGKIPDPGKPMPAWRWGGEALLWLLLLGLSGPVVFPLLAPLFGRLPDGGWILARTAGPFLFGTLLWAGAARGWWGFSPLACWVGAALLLLASRLVATFSPVVSDPLRASRRRALIAGEGVFWGTLLPFLLFKAFNPAVFWGEKPMNLSYLESLIRSPQLPPPDPWFSGLPLNYYHLGHYFAALPAKMLGTEPTIAFNLASAAIPALVAASAFSLVASMTGKFRWGVVGAAFTCLLGNGAALLELVKRGNAAGWGAWSRWMNFDYFWAPSRVIEGTINEFPFWTFLFSDLHAHLLAMPLFASLLLAGWLLFDSLAGGALLRSPRVAGPLLYGGLIAAVTYGVNPWSLPGTVLFLLLVAASGGAASGGVRGAVKAISGGVLALAAGVTLFLPYFLAYKSPVSGIRLLGKETSPIGPFLLIWGYLAAILLAWLVAVASRGRPGRRLLLLGLAVAVATAAGIAFGVDPGAALLAGSGVLLAAVGFRRDVRPDRRYALLLAGFGLALLAGCELLFIESRFNTVFKFHLQAWFPLAAAAAFALADLPGRYRLGRWGRRGVILLFGLATAVWFIFAVTGTRGKLVDDKSIAGELPTLDGMEFMRHRNPEEWQALTWLRRYAAGSPVVAEAAGPTYREYARVAMYTGLPSVLGWDYHLAQQGRPQAEIERRKASLKALFTGVAAPATFRAAREYGINLAYVGGVERSDFGSRAHEAFAPHLPAVFASGRTAIYELPSALSAGGRGGMSASAPLLETLREPLPVAPIRAVGNAFTGGRGQDPGFFHEPRGIDVTPGGDLLVVDFRNARLQRFDRSGVFLASYGRPGSGPGEMNDPSDVAAGADGLVYLLDTWNNRVQLLDDTGRMVAAWEGPNPGFYGPRGIAWSPEGIAVTDTGNSRVVIFRPDGTVSAATVAKGSAPGAFSLPVGIARDKEGFVVADTGNNRLQVITAEGKSLRTIPVPGWSGPGIKESYVAVASDGRYLVTDPAGSALIVIDPKGGSAARIPIAGSDIFPTGVAVDDEGRMLVVSTHQDRVIPVGGAAR
jgi:YYY domain-containing protein